MRMRLAQLIAALTLVVISILSVAVALPNKSTIFYHNHDVEALGSLGEGMRLYGVTDYLAVSQTSLGYFVEVASTQYNGHYCAYQGNFLPVNADRLRSSFSYRSEDDKLEICNFDVVFGTEIISVETSWGCRQEYCGAHGYWGKVTFSPLQIDVNPLAETQTQELCNQSTISSNGVTRWQDFSELARLELFSRGVTLLDCLGGFKQ